MGEAIRATVAYLGIDVGKRSHSACGLGEDGEVVFRSDLENRPADIDRLLERAGAGALVVVDQKRNIGALVLARAFAHGNPCAYLPGYAERQARGMFPGVAKTDAIDAEVIARTARGMPGALRPLAEEPEGAASLRILSSQREFAAAARTRAKNRLRATLLEADPALERAVDPSRGWHVAPPAEFGSAAGCSAAGWRRFSAAARRAGAPADSRSGTSVRSTSPQRGGNKQLKNLLIFSCNSLIGTQNRFGRYYDECRARGMRHNKALKAVARKRLKVIYAVMRDAVPYAA